MLTVFTNNDLSCRAIDFFFKNLFISIFDILKNPYGNLALDFRPMPSME